MAPVSQQHGVPPAKNIPDGKKNGSDFMSSSLGIQKQALQTVLLRKALLTPLAWAFRGVGAAASTCTVIYFSRALPLQIYVV